MNLIRTLLLLAASMGTLVLAKAVHAEGSPAAASVPSSTETAGRASLQFAVVIGNNASLGKRRPELRYADDDAARYFELFQTIAPGRVSLLAELDRDTQRLFPEASRNAATPSKENLDAVGRAFAKQVRAARAAGHDAEVYFIFAGHGDVEHGEGFIELSDARFRSSELEAFLRQIPFSRAHVILDSCNSFFMLGVRKPGGRHFATSEDAARSLATRLSNVGVFLSTSAEGEAFEWSEIQSGIFSHLVRSGLLGAADVNLDGDVSYLELAAFVDTATADVKNPNMRPQVYARGPGSLDEAPIARLQSLDSVKSYELGESASLRLRVRDASGLPLLDAHTEAHRKLTLRLPKAWARGAVLERAHNSAEAEEGRWHEHYALPEDSGNLTLASLGVASAHTAVRGPDETFRTLFAQPFGPQALAAYVTARSQRPARVYGVSQQDTQRMDLLLQQLCRFEGGRRVNDGLGAMGFGTLMALGGVGVLHYDSDLSSDKKTQAKITGGILLGLGSLITVGGFGSMFATTPSEEAAAEFRRAIEAGEDPAQAFATADARLSDLAEQRRQERFGSAFFGTLLFLGSVTGLTWSEISAEGEGDRMAPRLGWGAGAVGGLMIVGDAVLMETPVDTVTKLWREDPGLNQYRPVVHVGEDGASLGLFGEF